MRRPMPWVVLLGCLVLAACSRQGEVPWTGGDGPAEEELVGPALFEDITKTSGVKHAYRNGEDTADHLAILESLGGGVALIDYDGDGLLDLFLPGGGTFTGKDRKGISGW